MIWFKEEKKTNVSAYSSKSWQTNALRQSIECVLCIISIENEIVPFAIAAVYVLVKWKPKSFLPNVYGRVKSEGVMIVLLRHGPRWK